MAVNEGIVFVNIAMVEGFCEVLLNYYTPFCNLTMADLLSLKCLSLIVITSSARNLYLSLNLPAVVIFENKTSPTIALKIFSFVTSA